AGAGAGRRGVSGPVVPGGDRGSDPGKPRQRVRGVRAGDRGSRAAGRGRAGEPRFLRRGRELREVPRAGDVQLRRGGRALRGAGAGGRCGGGESTAPPGTRPFLALALADGARGTRVIGFLHFPPAAVGDEPFVSGLRARGVSRLFTGHWHQSRTLHYDGVTDYNMSPMAMGGLDMTPGGYRVVTVAGADVRMAYHATVERPILRLVHPLPGACVRAGTIDLVAAAEDGGSPLTVTARIDGGAPVELPAAGGWARVASVTVGEATHGVDILADRPGY